MCFPLLGLRLSKLGGFSVVSYCSVTFSLSQDKEWWKLLKRNRQHIITYFNVQVVPNIAFIILYNSLIKRHFSILISALKRLPKNIMQETNVSEKNNSSALLCQINYFFIFFNDKDNLTSKVSTLGHVIYYIIKQSII